MFYRLQPYYVYMTAGAIISSEFTTADRKNILQLYEILYNSAYFKDQHNVLDLF